MSTFYILCHRNRLSQKQKKNENFGQKILSKKFDQKGLVKKV